MKLGNEIRLMKLGNDLILSDQYELKMRCSIITVGSNELELDN